MNRTELDKAYAEMGRINENTYEPIMTQLYGEISKGKNEFDSIDFYGKDFMIELKSRCCNSTDFKDTMFGYNKIVRADNTLAKKAKDYKVYFAFAFTDGLFIWQYNSNTYQENGGDNQKRIGGTSNRGKDDYKEHYYVLIKNLKKVNDTSVWIHPIVKANTNKPKFTSNIPSGVCLLTFKKC